MNMVSESGCIDSRFGVPCRVLVLGCFLFFQLGASGQHLEPSKPLGQRGKATPYAPTVKLKPKPSAPSPRLPNRLKPAVEEVETKPRTFDKPESELTAEWIAQAIDAYPALAIKDSPINKA